MMSAPAVMSAQALATHLGVAERTVRRWITSGDLPAERRGRAYAIRREDGERVRLTMLGGQAAEDRAQLEAAAATRDLEYAQLQGRYNELREHVARVTRERDAALERAARAEAERDLLTRRVA